MRTVIRKMIPRSIRSAVVRRRAVSENRHGNLWCPICESVVVEFLPHGNPPRPDILCPVCHSKACHRLAWAWFQQNAQVFRQNGVFLHVAPEAELGKRLVGHCRQAGMKYQHGDLRDPQNPIDIMNLKLGDESVDVFFACHVLNMVPNDLLAIREVFRVLKPDGVAILPVPIHLEILETVEASAMSAPAERLELFNDELMYRKYTADEYLKRLRLVGLEPANFRPVDVSSQSRSKWMLCEEFVQTAVKLKTRP
jgi:hypothetical protein